MERLKKVFENILYRWRLNRAIKVAIKAHEADGRKYLVIDVEGKPTVVAKSHIRSLRKRKMLKRGVTVSDVEKAAYFVTK